MYSEKVMDHFMNPRNVGELSDADGVGMEGNPTCGDVMKIFIKVEDGRISDAKFKTFGCGASIAVSSMVTEMIKGKTIDEALSISKEAVAMSSEACLPEDALLEPRSRCPEKGDRRLQDKTPLACFINHARYRGICRIVHIVLQTR